MIEDVNEREIARILAEETNFLDQINKPIQNKPIQTGPIKRQDHQEYLNQTGIRKGDSQKFQKLDGDSDEESV